MDEVKKQIILNSRNVPIQDLAKLLKLKESSIQKVWEEQVQTTVAPTIKKQMKIIDDPNTPKDTYDKSQHKRVYTDKKSKPPAFFVNCKKCGALVSSWVEEIRDREHHICSSCVFKERGFQ